MGFFQDLNDQGITLVFVTHESDIAQHAKRRIVLKDGEIQSDEPVVNRTLCRWQTAAVAGSSSIVRVMSPGSRSARSTGTACGRR